MISCPRCDPRPITEQDQLALCDTCRTDLDRHALVTAGAQRTPNTGTGKRQKPAGDVDGLRDVRAPTGVHAAVTEAHSDDDDEGGEE